MTIGADPVAEELGRAFGGDVDLRRIVKLEVTGRSLGAVDADGRVGSLLLTSPVARADLLYRLADRCAPLLRERIAKLGAEGRSYGVDGSTGFWGVWIALVSLALPVVLGAYYAGVQLWWVVLGGVVECAFLVLTRPVAFESRPIPLTLDPIGPVLRRGGRSIRLDEAKFDVTSWGQGKAVLTDGRAKIRIDFRKYPGVFTLFALLVERCGSPDDRLVD